MTTGIKIPDGWNMSKKRRMKMKKILVLAILATMFVGCEQDNTPEKDDFIHTGVYFSYGAEFTRTSLDADNGGSYFLWKAGDKIGVSCEEAKVTNKEAVVATQYDNQRKAAFSTGIEFNGDAEHTFNIYYPYKASTSAYPVNPTSVRHTLSANQNGAVGAYDFMWDQVTASKENPVARGEMKHPFAYIRFYIVNVKEKDENGDIVNADVAVAGREVTAISMKSDGTLVGDFTADFNNFEKNQVSFGGSTSSSVTLTPTEPLTILTVKEYNEAKKDIPDNYPVLIINPAGVGASFDVSVQVAGMAPMNTTFNMGSRKFEANNFYNIGLGGSFVNGKLTFTVIDWERVTLDVTFN